MSAYSALVLAANAGLDRSGGRRNLTKAKARALFGELGLLNSKRRDDVFKLAAEISALFDDSAARRENDRFFAPGSIAGTDKVYIAAWAALLAVEAHNRSNDQKVRTVAFPSMGTGFGGVGFSEAARQMAAAYRHYLQPPHRLNWDVVADRQKAICYDGDRQVVR